MEARLQSGNEREAREWDCLFRNVAVKKGRKRGRGLEMCAALPLAFCWGEPKHTANKHGCSWAALCLLNLGCEEKGGR